MAVRGAKPKPTALKVLEGNRGHRPLPKNEVVPQSSVPVEGYDWLEPDAQEEWERLAGPLQELGVLTYMDRAAFKDYCVAYGEVTRLQKYFAENPHMKIITNKETGAIQLNPQYRLLDRYTRELYRMETEFGLTPSSRARIGAIRDKAEQEDPMAMLLKDMA